MKKTIYTITEYLARGSVFFLLVIFIGKLKQLACIDTTNKMWMLLVIIFIWEYSVNKYWDAIKW